MSKDSFIAGVDLVLKNLQEGNAFEETDEWTGRVVLNCFGFELEVYKDDTAETLYEQYYELAKRYVEEKLPDSKTTYLS